MTEDNKLGLSDGRFNEMIEELNGQLKSRRGFLGDAAKVGGGALALSIGGAGSAAAWDKDDKDEVSDLDILNYALTLEQLEATYYTEGLEEFSESEVENSDAANVLMPDTLQYSTYNFFEQVRDHEQAHVDAITKTIEKLGGEPVSGLEFAFPYNNLEEFLAVAKALENTGVAAYAGAAPLIENDAVLAAALSIHSVEARHAGYFNLLNRTTPFPAAFDEPKSMEEVKKIASQFIVS